MSKLEVRLGDVCDVARGKVITQKQTTPGDIPVVAGGMKPSYTHGQANIGAGVITVSGSGANAGFVAYWDEPIWASDCSTIKPLKDSGVDAKFMYRQLKALEPFIQDSLRQGAAQPHVYAKDLAELLVVIPMIEEQRRISAILEAAESLRSKRREALAKLETLTQAIFVDMFGDLARNERAWPERTIGDLSVSDGIKCGPFGTQLAAAEYAKAGVPLWGIPHVNRGFAVPTYEYLSPAKAESLRTYDLRPGDIVMTRKGTVGNCAVYPDHLPVGVMHSDLLRLRLGADANSAFMSAQLSWSRSVAHQVRSMSGGAIMAGINVTKLKGLVVLAPPLELQEKFAGHARAARSYHEQVVAGSEGLDELFSSLQQRAFRGEL